jgi:quercetin dioxygenase-like cupin family protein
MRWHRTLCLVTLIAAIPSGGRGAVAVEKSGQESKIAFERVISGHLTELNGKYKLRVTETVYAPGGYIGEHHHAGPGIRLVQSGELAYVQGPKTTVYKTGDYFFESGDVTHTAYNKTKGPVRVLNFEILPADWQGASAIGVPDSSGHHE